MGVFFFVPPFSWGSREIISTAAWALAVPGATLIPALPRTPQHFGLSHGSPSSELGEKRFMRESRVVHVAASVTRYHT